MVLHQIRFSLFWRGLIILPVITLLALPDALSATPIELDSPHREYQINTGIKMVEEPTGRYKLEDVLASSVWQSHNEANINLGYSLSTFWLRFKLKNKNRNQHWVLVIDNPSLDHVEFIALSNQNIISRQVAGDGIPFKMRPLTRRLLVFDIPHNYYGNELEIILRLQSESPLNVPISIWSADRFATDEQIKLLLLGLFYGIVVALLLNLAGYAAVRDRTYLYYVGWIACLSLYLATSDGLAFQYLWPNFPDWANHSSSFFLNLSTAAGAMFAATFLSVSSYSRPLDIFLKSVSVVALIISGFTLILSYRDGAVLSGCLLMTQVITIIITGLVGVQKKLKPARNFVLYWAVLLFSIMATLMLNFGIFSASKIPIYGVRIGVVLGMILTSISLGLRITSLHRARDQAEYQSTIDPLTGLANRRNFEHYLQSEWKQAIFNQKPVSLLMIDIDFFKKYNDLYGHVKGDACLVKVARTIDESLNFENQLFARYGGEEFAIVLPGMGSENAVNLARQLRRNVLDKKIAHAGSSVSSILTISVGVATLLPDHDSMPINLVSAADTALYSAKNSGRSRIAQYDIKNL